MFWLQDSATKGDTKKLSKTLATFPNFFAKGYLKIVTRLESSGIMIVT